MPVTLSLLKVSLDMKCEKNMFQSRKFGIFVKYHYELEKGNKKDTVVTRLEEATRFVSLSDRCPLIVWERKVHSKSLKKRNIVAHGTENLGI